ncbi:MAG: DNA replication/repair protein RecF [Cryomorphaceae bacterium]|nr:DNA replication/repair protein RecF [Cryomorphaceae bacterium]
MNEWILESLQLLNFKSYEEAQFAFGPRINCLVGQNGAGKTNVLDAIHYLSNGKSYFNAIDAQNIKHQQNFMTVEGKYLHADQREHIHLALEKGQRKKIRRNQELYKRLSDHIGLIPVVVISPSDRDLITEGSEPRRKFLDGTIAQTNTAYLDHLLQYHQVLKQRNSMLRKGISDESLLDIYDAQLVNHGLEIYRQRLSFCDDFAENVSQHYKEISGDAERISFAYKSKITPENYVELMQGARQKDRILEYTTVGIHRDDLAFNMDGRSVKRFGSQGQQKTYLIALKLAQYHYLHLQKGFKPLLLLDDIFDKLDASRVHHIINSVSNGVFGQIFITDTHPERAEKLAGEGGFDAKIIRIERNKMEAS